MWLAIEISVAAVTFVLLFQTARTLRGDWLSILLITILWLRYVLAALDDYTVPPMVGEHSMIALSSMAIVALGCLVVPVPLLTQRRAFPAHLIVLWMMFSAVLNGALNGAMVDLFKWLYFLIVLALAFRLFQRYGLDVGLRLLLVPLSTPMLLQVASVVTSTPTLGADGHYNFIGGYFHEAVFSIVVMTTMWIMALLWWRRQWHGDLLVFACFVGIILANYRTTIIAALPILLIYGLNRGAEREMGMARIGVLLVIVLASIPIALSPEVQARFDDLLIALGNVENLIKPAQEYTQAQRELLSTRVYLWAQYIGAFADADFSKQIIGFGPQSYTKSFLRHPHNMYIYALYEGGIVGLILLFTMLAANIAIAARIADTKVRWLVLSGHFGFLLACLATSPFSVIEGLIFYAVLCAATWYVAEASSRSRGYRSPVP